MRCLAWQGGDAAAAARPLARATVASYALGHVLNDMCAACWFSYLLLYLEEARDLSPLEAGAVLFTGQLMDALATPVVGLLSDSSKGWPALGLGRRKLWNLGGAIGVAVCFLGVFATCVACWGDGGGFGGGGGGGGAPSTAASRTVVFALFAGLFNVGWAAVQVSHMALVPELTALEGERVLLNSARYGMTVMSNCAVFVAVWAILRVADEARPAPTADGTPTPEIDLAGTYQTLSFVVLGVGGLCTALFLVGTPEPLGGRYEPLEASAENFQEGSATASGPRSPAAQRAEGDELKSVGGEVRRSVMTWRDWLRLRSFYQVMAVYSLTRLSTNVSQVYLTFFVTASLRMDQTAIAFVPLLLYIAQLSATFFMRPFAARFGRRNSMTLGAALIGAACGIMLTLDHSSANVVYAAMLLLGAGSAVVMIISVSMQSDLIANNTESGAFVYGAMSFADKLSNGIAIIAVQFAGDSVSDGDKGSFVRVVNGLVPLVAIASATAVCWTVRFPKHLQSLAQQVRADADAAAVAAAALSAPVPPAVPERRTSMAATNDARAPLLARAEST